MAADGVERFARDPAGGCGDDGAEVGILDQRVDVDAPEDGIQVDPVQQRIQIDLVQQRIQVDLVQQRIQINLVQQRIHIQRGNHKVDCTLREGLGQRLAARDQPAIHRAPPSKLIHKISIAALSEPGSPRRGEPVGVSGQIRAA